MNAGFTTEINGYPWIGPVSASSCKSKQTNSSCRKVTRQYSRPALKVDQQFNAEDGNEALTAESCGVGSNILNEDVKIQLSLDVD